MTTDDNKQEIISSLCKAFVMEVEKIENYLAASKALKGSSGTRLKKIFENEVDVDLEHARKLSARIKTLGGTVPGKAQMERAPRLLEPPTDSNDLATVVREVIAVEETTIAHYLKIIDLCEGQDYTTRILANKLSLDEDKHRREFKKLLRNLKPELSTVKETQDEQVYEHAKVA